MSAMTADAITDRVRSVCAGPPFMFAEAERWDTFEDVPATAIHGSFRIVPPSSQFTNGTYDYAEDRTDVLQIWVARRHGTNYQTVRRALLRDMHSLTAAVVRDAHQFSGDYGILDGGRGHTIATVPGAEYVTLRLSLPINYDAQL